MPDQKPGIGRPERPRRVGVLVFQHFQRGPADDAGETWGVHERQRTDRAPQPQFLREDGNERQREEERGERQQHVHRPHNDVVGQIAVVRRDDPETDAQRRRGSDRYGPVEDRVPRAVQHPRKDVACLSVGAEGVVSAWRRLRGVDAELRCEQRIEVVGQSGVDREHDYERDDRESGHREPVREQLREERAGSDPLDDTTIDRRGLGFGAHCSIRGSRTEYVTSTPKLTSVYSTANTSTVAWTTG